MFTLSKKTDYALIALAYLAERSHCVASAREIAGAFRLPPALLMNILKSLHQHGILRSLRGTKGGYQININPREVSLYELIEAVDGPVQMSMCAGDGCRIGPGCPVQGPLAAVQRKLVGFLKDVRLSDVITGGVRGEGSGVRRREEVELGLAVDWKEVSL